MVRHSPRRFGLCFVCMLCLGGCDGNWEQRAENAYRQGEEARLAGQWLEARTRYEAALAANPYHAAANLRLAEMYDTRLFGEKNANALAIRHYRRFLELPSADSRLKNQVANIVAVLQRVADGTLEDPAAAVEDFLAAARAGAERIFTERLDARLIHKLSFNDVSIAKHMKTWQARLEGRTTHLSERWLDEISAKRAEVTVEILGDPSGPIIWQIQLNLSDTGTWEIAGYGHPDETPATSPAKKGT